MPPNIDLLPLRPEGYIPATYILRDRESFILGALQARALGWTILRCVFCGHEITDINACSQECRQDGKPHSVYWMSGTGRGYSNESWELT